VCAADPFCLQGHRETEVIGAEEVVEIVLETNRYLMDVSKQCAIWASTCTGCWAKECERLCG
jgi:hypothetical protein